MTPSDGTYWHGTAAGLRGSIVAHGLRRGAGGAVWVTPERRLAVQYIALRLVGEMTGTTAVLGLQSIKANSGAGVVVAVKLDPGELRPGADAGELYVERDVPASQIVAVERISADEVRAAMAPLLMLASAVACTRQPRRMSVSSQRIAAQYARPLT